MSDINHDSAIRRALSGDFGDQWREMERARVRENYSKREEIKNLPEIERERILRKIEDVFSDPRILLISTDRGKEAETVFEEDIEMNPLIVDDEVFMQELDRMRNICLSETLQTKTDPLSLYAILYNQKPEPLPTEVEAIPHYIGYFERMGPERSGQLEEVIGPMGSGKSNFLTWKAIRSLELGHVVITNFKLRNVPKDFRDNWIEVHSYIKLFEETMKFKKSNYNGLIFWIIDEQGRMPGGSSQTANMREGRWSSELITLIRKFGVFFTRARQNDNIPSDQLDWVSFLVEKNIREPEVVSIKRMHNSTIDEAYSFTIPSMKNHYDTNDPCLMVMDLNMEMVLKYATRKEQKGAKPLDALDEAIRIAKKLEEKSWKKFESDMREIDPELVGEEKRKINPKSLKNLVQYRDKNQDESMDENDKTNSDSNNQN